MSDILDGLEDFDEASEDEFDEDDNPSSGLVINEDGEEVDDDLEILDENELTEPEARDLTDSIKSTVVATYVLLSRAHEGKAYKALGYSTWKEYVSSEFDFSTQRSYQLLDLAKTAKAIEEAAPEGYEANLTEAQARDIKRELPKITERISAETEGLSAEDSTETIDSIIQESREQRKADEKVMAADDRQRDQEAEERRQQELNEEADRLLDEEPGLGGGDGSGSDGDYGDFDEGSSGDSGVYSDENSGPSAREAMALHTFTTIVSARESLISPKDMVDLIPDNRRELVEKDFRELLEWMQDFDVAWDEEHEGE